MLPSLYLLILQPLLQSFESMKAGREEILELTAGGKL